MYRRILATLPLALAVCLSQAGCSDRLAVPETEQLHNRSLALIRMGRRNEAMQTLEKALEIDPKDYDILETYWELRFRKDEDAAERLKALEKADPTDPSNPRLLGTLLPDAAERVSAGHRALKLLPDEPQIYQRIGEAFMELDRLDSAEVYLSKAVGMEPLPSEASLDLARLKVQRGDRREGETLFRRIIEEGEDHDVRDSAVRELFFFYWDSGKIDQAIDLARNSMARTEDPWVLNDLAYSIADLKADLTLAENLAKEAIDGMNPDWIEREYPQIDRHWAESTSSRYRGYLDDTLAFVYLQGGKTDDAIDVLEAGVKLIPYVDPDVTSRLAGAYRDAGRLDEAIESLLEILATSMNDAAMSQLVEIYTEKHGDTTGIASLISERRKREIRPATEFRMTGMNGEEISLSDYRGDVVLLNFWFPT